eukprot:TRINITY_DN4754_c0_g1_i12.p1 TRINITY_DN4754_c0_g1~~TRINITY_DN4754_c0_g1_i12.p1  ORF type:complete len:765 (-),score=172.15 TRINITY_DN4754_c0_g1_i12:351-2324(-)
MSGKVLKASVEEVCALEDNATAGLEEASPVGQDSMSGKTEQQNHALETTATDASGEAAHVEAERTSSDQLLKTSVEVEEVIIPEGRSIAGLEEASWVDDISGIAHTETFSLEYLGVSVCVDESHGAANMQARETLGQAVMGLTHQILADATVQNAEEQHGTEGRRHQGKAERCVNPELQQERIPTCVKVLMQEGRGNLGLGLKQQSVGGKTQLLVQEVLGSGVVADHNMKQTNQGCQDQLVLPGMLLVGINSVEMSSELILQAFSAGLILDVLFAQKSPSCVKVLMKDGDGNLGLGLMQRNVGGKQELVVEQILEDGVVASHNIKQTNCGCKDQLVRPGMRLVGVNGTETSLQSIFESLAAGSAFDVLFSVPQDVTSKSASNMDGAIKALQAFHLQRQHMKQSASHPNLRSAAVERQLEHMKQSMSHSDLRSATMERQQAFAEHNPKYLDELAQVAKKLDFTSDAIDEDVRAYPTHHEQVMRHEQVQAARRSRPSSALEPTRQRFTTHTYAEAARPSSALESNRQRFTIRIQKRNSSLGLMFKPLRSGISQLEELLVVSVEPTGAVARHNAHHLSQGSNDLVVEAGMHITAVNGCRGDVAAMVKALSFGNVVELELKCQGRRAHPMLKHHQIIQAVRAVQQLQSSSPKRLANEDGPR